LLVPLLGPRLTLAPATAAVRGLPLPIQGGKTIKAIGEASGATLEVEDNGDVWVSAPSSMAAQVRALHAGWAGRRQGRAPRRRRPL
jgi:hypothetical protein